MGSALRFKQSWRLRSPFSACLGIFLLLLQAGCARPPEPERLSPAIRASLGRIGVAAGRFEPKVAFEGFARGKGQGAATGAGQALAGYFEAVGQSHCQGEVCGAFYLLVLMAAPVVAAGGAVVGSVTAESAGKVEPALEAANRALKGLQLQQTLASRVCELAPVVAGRELQPLADAGPLSAEEAPAYRSQAAKGVDTVLETAVLEIGTRGTGINSPVALFIRARLRLVRTADDTVLYQREYLYVSSPRKFLEWAAEDARPMCEGLSAGIDDLARRVVHGILVVPKE